MSIQTESIEAYENSIIMQDRIKIKQRINFLQQSLVQLSFLTDSHANSTARPELFRKLNQSLLLTKRLLKENQLIQLNISYTD